MDTLKIGSLITTHQERDAVHMAIAPVTAGQELRPGLHVGLNADGLAVSTATHIGIVDPFVRERVIDKGDRFWLFLYPGSITSLRHDWTHPAFSGCAIGPAPKSDSEMWLREYCDKKDVDYDSMIRDHFVGENSGFNDYISPEFKHHYFNVTGSTEVPYFSCAC